MWKRTRAKKRMKDIEAAIGLHKSLAAHSWFVNVQIDSTQGPTLVANVVEVTNEVSKVIPKKWKNYPVTIKKS